MFGLVVQMYLAANSETITKHGYKTDENNKKVSKREYYAPEYNHDQYVCENNNFKFTS